MGQVRRVVVGRVLGSHQSDGGRYRGQRGEHCLRVRPAHNVQRVRPAEVFPQTQSFAEEERGEQSPLGRLR